MGVPVSPTHAVIAVTNRCNARCVMCDIWKQEPGEELRPEEYQKLPSSLRQINLTGGEPLLRTDLAQVVRCMCRACPKARIVLSTNGLLPDRLARLLAETENLAVRVSLDGIGDLHNRIRGIDTAYQRALESLKVCKKAGTRDVGISATMSKYNAGRIREIHDLARRQGVEFTFTVAHSSSFFFGDQRDREPHGQEAMADLTEMRSRLFDSWQVKDWFRAYFVEGLIAVIRGSPRPIRCRAGRDFFYLDAAGNLYPCHILEHKMGNIRQKSFHDIIAESGWALEKAETCRQRCWMTCTVAPEMRRKLPVFAFKVGRAKMAHHVRRLLRAE
jgi:MoaA/NifB/PqqE/SkfB family radical SAM enzyme